MRFKKVFAPVLACALACTFAFVTSGCTSSSEDGSSTDAETSQQETSSFSSQCLDAHNNVSLYAAMELSGEEINELLVNQGYEWDGNSSVWYRATDGARYSSASVITGSEITELSEEGATSKMSAYMTISGYDSANAALNGVAQCTINVNTTCSNGMEVAIAATTSGQRLVVIAENEDSTFGVTLVGPDGLNQLAMQQLAETFDADFGSGFSSISDAYTALTGEQADSSSPSVVTLDTQKEYKGYTYTISSKWKEEDGSDGLVYTIDNSHQFCVSYFQAENPTADEFYAAIKSGYTEDSEKYSSVTFTDVSQNTETVNDVELTIYEYAVSYTSVETGDKFSNHYKAAYTPCENGFMWIYEAAFSGDSDVALFDSIISTLHTSQD